LLGKPTREDIESMESVMAKECINQINVGKKKSFTSFFGTIDSDALDLLNHLLVFNPKERYTAK
jgi:enoyl-[acyl-carrier-protein] reductase (NADH)